MKIEDKRQRSTTLGNLVAGAVFEAEVNEEQGYFIKTDKQGSYGDTDVCINLCTGETYGLFKNTVVVILNAKLVVVDLGEKI